VGMSWDVVCPGCVFARARYKALGGFGTARESEIAYAHQVNVVGVGLFMRLLGGIRTVCESEIVCARQVDVVGVFFASECETRVPLCCEKPPRPTVTLSPPKILPYQAQARPRTAAPRTGCRRWRRFVHDFSDARNGRSERGAGRGWPAPCGGDVCPTPQTRTWGALEAGRGWLGVLAGFRHNRFAHSGHRRPSGAAGRSGQPSHVERMN